MKCLLNVCISLWLVTMTTSEEIPKCHGVTDEQMAEIKKMVVTEDIDSKLSGNYTAVYGPKAILDKDSESCIYFTYQPSDEHIDYSVFIKSKLIESGVANMKSELHKVSNGIYVTKKPTGKPAAVSYYVFSKGNVLARFMCFTEAPNPGSPIAKIVFDYIVVIETTDPLMPPDTKEQVDEAAKMLKQHPEIYGEIATYEALTCPVVQH